MNDSHVVVKNPLAPMVRYSQQYFKGSNGLDYYAWYLDGVPLSNGLTNFSYSTYVKGGGEVSAGVEAMGNTLIFSNKKTRKNADGSYTSISWGSHINSQNGDDAPYTNTNSATDPNNAWYSTGKE